MLTSYGKNVREGPPPETLKELFGSVWLQEELAEIARWTKEQQYDYAEYYERLFVRKILELISNGHPQAVTLAKAATQLLATKRERTLDDFTP